MNREELKALLLFNRITNYTPRQKFELHERYMSALEIFHSRAEAEAMYKKPFKINGRTINLDDEMASAEKECGYCSGRGIEVVDISSNRYPVRLKYIYDPPLVLFASGRCELLMQELTVGVVGARKASNAGITLAFSVARDLSRAGAVVVSGLATGIDFYAHKGALEGVGSTVAVLGNGIDVVYPKENEEMYRKVGNDGCVLSEFPLGTAPFKQNFPRRNRIISGLSAGLVVVEAAEFSGALITAGHALEQGREVMAFPGRAGSEFFSGNNRLIKEGAHLVEDASDILSLLGKETSPKSKETASLAPLAGAILRVIGDEKVSIETIERVLGDPISKIASELMLLELKGSVVQHPGKIFSRVYRHGT